VKAKKQYPYPSAKNPVRLFSLKNRNLVNLDRLRLLVLSYEIERGEIVARRKGKSDKIPALPFHFGGLGVGYYSWCFACFKIISEAERHYYIKNRNDARF
jgi:hypothetical protein